MSRFFSPLPKKLIGAATILLQANFANALTGKEETYGKPLKKKKYF